MLSQVEGQIISRTYPQEIGVSRLLSAVLDGTMFQQQLDIASRIPEELLGIAIKGIKEKSRLTALIALGLIGADVSCRLRSCW
jgi:hypothetical protein